MVLSLATVLGMVLAIVGRWLFGGELAFLDRPGHADHAGDVLGDGMRLGYVGGVGEFAEIGFGDGFRPRGALGASFAGPFLGAYFKHGYQSEQQMVAWLNSLTPHQADVIASAIKSFPDNWQSVPMTQLAQAFDDALLKYGVMPPIQLI